MIKIEQQTLIGMIDHVDMGSGRYGLIYQGKEVKDKGGKSIIVNVNDVPKEDLQISKSGIS